MRTLFLAVLGLGLAGADDPWDDATTVDLLGHARAVSLDVRGVVPTAEELAAIEAAGQLDETLLDAWLASPEFTQVALEKHRELFWNNLEINLLGARRLARRSSIHFVSGRARILRGITQTHCGTFEAEVDELNRPLSWQTNSDGSISEGWVWVDPYWDPGSPVQVCAFDAQLTEVSESGVDCSSEDARTETDCGCGPQLQWCLTSAVETEIEEALVTDLDRRVEAMLDSGAPWDSLFRSPTMHLSGPSTHFFRHLVAFRPDDYESPVPADELPELAYADAGWAEVTLPAHNAGVLTAPAWLLRHQTDRGRANRFYSGFLCQEFLPTEGPIDSLSAEALPTPDLQVRSGCLDCHARLEPWSAYWGRWSPAGSVYLSPEDYPVVSEECETCARAGTNCSDHCDDHYIVEASHPDEEPWLGTLQTHAFLSEDHAEHPLLGPLGWVEAATSSGELAACAVDRTTRWLLQAPASADQAADWSTAFATGQDLRALIKDVVTSPAYWGGAE